MKPGIKKLVLFLAVLIAIMAGLAAWWVLPARRAEVRLSPKSQEIVSRNAFASESFFLQTDPRWATEKIGGSGEPLRWVGCTICCLSMALAHHGVDLNPSELNRKLKEMDGFTHRGWVKWDAVRIASKERVRVELPPNPTHKVINEALAIGDPVLVKVPLRTGVQHWVLLVGRDQNEYLMRDPLGDGKSTKFLSSLGGDILAVRIVRKI